MVKLYSKANLPNVKRPTKYGPEKLQVLNSGGSKVGPGSNPKVVPADADVEVGGAKFSYGYQPFNGQNPMPFYGVQQDYLREMGDKNIYPCPSLGKPAEREDELEELYNDALIKSAKDDHEGER